MKTNNIVIATVVIIFSFAIITLISCGGNNEEIKKTDKITVKKVISATKGNTDGVILQLTGNDQMQYNKLELRAKVGEKITLILKHIGKMPITSMGHNFVLLKPGTDIAIFAEKSMASKDNDYIPESDDIIAHTKMLGGGESDTITFDAPAKGTYDYICSFPGHYGIMRGILIVE